VSRALDVSAFIVGALLAPVPALPNPSLPPWRDPDDLPLPEGIRSAVIQRNDQAIIAEPSAGGSRRGTARIGARLPWFGAKRGSGCSARWINVGPHAWICQDVLALDANAPLELRGGREGWASSGLPFQYYFVGRNGSNGYLRLNDAEEVAPDLDLEPGFAVAIVDQAVKQGVHYARTHHDQWIPLRDLVPVVPFDFHGHEVTDDKLDFGWVVEDKAIVLSSPLPLGAGGAAKPARFRQRFEKVDVLEEKTGKGAAYYRIGPTEWLRARDVRRPTVSPRPSSLRAGERWIDIDLVTQTLVAWEGERPVYATLVSTGKGLPGTDEATPKGEFRIWVKLESSNMDNLEDEEAKRYYAIEDVPYVQYFDRGVGLHGAFWHRAFGHVRSHGCVNLAPLDAQHLFAFTSPHLPAGWTAVLPTPVESGTLVRVR